MSPMNTIFSRTRKREVTQDWSQAERNPVTKTVHMTSEESFAYENTIDNYIDEHYIIDEYGREVKGGLGMVTLKRQLASSVWATLNDLDTLDRGIDEYSDCKDAKFEELLRILQTVFAHGKKKIIIFAIFKKTSLIPAASPKVVESYMRQHYEGQGLSKILAPLMKNVPYRFLSPWIKFSTTEDVVAKSNAKGYNGLYAINKDGILLDEDWWEYIEENYDKIYSFALNSFVEYVSQYNNPMKLIKLKMKYNVP